VKWEKKMNTIKIAAMALIIAGVLGLAYGGFTYTRQTHQAKVGPFELSVQDNKTVNVPIWAGVGVILLGGVLLLVGTRKA
jgi:hypothetical protein